MYFYNLSIEKTRERERFIWTRQDYGCLRAGPPPLPYIPLIRSPIFRYLISRSWEKYHKKITKFPFSVSSVSVNFFIYLPFWNCSQESFANRYSRVSVAREIVLITRLKKDVKQISFFLFGNCITLNLHQNSRSGGVGRRINTQQTLT